MNRQLVFFLRGNTINIYKLDLRGCEGCDNFWYSVFTFLINAVPMYNSSCFLFIMLQLVNKFDELLFTKNDENFVEAFAIFCGMGIHNTHMYEKAITAMAKQSVTLDVSYYRFY